MFDLSRWQLIRGFDHIAPHFDEFAVLHREASVRLLERLDFFQPEVERALDLGCATGSVASDLQARYPAALVTRLDWSMAMLKRQQDGPPGTLQRVCADMERLPLAAGRQDLVVSNLGLQWCERLGEALLELRRALRPGGLLLFTLPGPETLHELRAARAQLPGAGDSGNFLDMHALGDLLVNAGFRDPVMDRDHIHLDYPDITALVRDMKNTGSLLLERPAIKGLGGQAWLRHLQAVYKTAEPGGRLPASVEIIYGAAKSPPEGQPIRREQGEEAVFSVEALIRRQTGK